MWSYQQDAWHQLWEYVDPKAEDKTFSTSIQAMLPLAEVCSLMYIFTPSRIFYPGFIVLFLIYLIGDRVR